jgi:hypothetical protein
MVTKNPYMASIPLERNELAKLDGAHIFSFKVSLWITSAKDFVRLPVFIDIQIRV